MFYNTFRSYQAIAKLLLSTVPLHLHIPTLNIRNHHEQQKQFPNIFCTGRVIISYSSNIFVITYSFKVSRSPQKIARPPYWQDWWPLVKWFGVNFTKIRQEVQKFEENIDKCMKVGPVSPKIHNTTKNVLNKTGLNIYTLLSYTTTWQVFGYLNWFRTSK
jgi:hypothetical protein